MGKCNCQKIYCLQKLFCIITFSFILKIKILLFEDKKLFSLTIEYLKNLNVDCFDLKKANRLHVSHSWSKTLKILVSFECYFSSEYQWNDTLKLWSCRICMHTFRFRCWKIAECIRVTWNGNSISWSLLLIWISSRWQIGKLLEKCFSNSM